MKPEESDALRAKARDPAHKCVRCGHLRIQHSYDRADDFMCLKCPPDECFYDPYTPAEWKKILGFAQ